ncbi:MAG: hypothetical protein H7A01_03545 [Hahellaceae bacterium]|nr:hypothetical protein [Hahellaceae bacterium]MCP5212280.1 hypothetical protein [Hahellaceae bacterium]
MAIPNYTPLPLSGNALVDAVTNGYYWDTGADNTINWSLSDNVVESLFWNNPNATGGIISKIDDIFTTLSFYINVNFNFIGYYDSPVTAAAKGSDINISLSMALFSSSNILARAIFPNGAENESAYPGAPGDIYLNLDSPAASYPSYDAGTQGWFVLLHEIGHALGLKHPHDDGGTGRPTLTDIGLAALDYDWVSVMSYEEDYGLNLLQFDPSTPMFLDILGLQYLYGENIASNAGDGIFRLSKTGSYVTLYDPTGIDAVDARGNADGWYINLNFVENEAVGFALPSSEVDLPSPLNFYWLMGDFEIVYGTDYNDTIVGNGHNNIISGGTGNDYLDGGAGIDSAVFYGTRSSYALVRGQSKEVISGVDGIDELIGIERLIFADNSLALDVDGNAGKVASLLGAVFGAESIHNQEYVGIGLTLFDSGQSMEQVADLALRAVGAVSHDDVVERLYGNLFGSAPSQNEKAAYVSLLDNGVYSSASLAVAAADLVDDYGVVDLVGLQQTGIEYI